MSEPWGVILTASYGHGHNVASQAIIDCCQQIRPGIRFEMIDYFNTFVSKLYATATTISYVQSVKRAPYFYGLFYDLTSQVKPNSSAQRGINALGKTNFAEWYRRNKPSVIICSYPTPAGSIRELKDEGVIDAALAIVVTDYALHSQWVHPGADLTCVGASFLKEALIGRGLDPDDVMVSGIPISAKFRCDYDKAEERRKWGLRQDRPVVLVMSGAFGMMRGLFEVMRVLRREPDVQAVFVCGHDRRSLGVMTRATEPYRDRMQVLPFTDKVHELMTAADLIVTKAGGITVTEALVTGLPMLIHRPIHGQEYRNLTYLSECGAAVGARNGRALARLFPSLVHSPEELRRMREAGLRIARPNAARDIAQAIIGLMDRGR